MHNDYIDEISLGLLELYSKRKHLSLSGLAAICDSNVFGVLEPVSYLIEKGYLQIEPNFASLEGSDLTPDAPIIITHNGLVALEAELKKRRNYKHSEFRNWFTLAIAIVSLIVSIIAIIKP